MEGKVLGKMTLERWETLKLIDEICGDSEFNLASIGKLIEVITSKKKIKPGTVRIMVLRLHKEEYIESPLRGCWRLAEKGKEILREVKPPGDMSLI